MELGRYGVTVNAVSPLADTRMLESIPESAEKIRKSRGILGANLSRRCGLPENIAAFVIYLASDEARRCKWPDFLCHRGADFSI